MGVSWKYLDSDSKDALLGRMVTVSPLGPHSASMAFTGLSKMGASWDSLPADARSSLQDSFPMPSQASEQVVANMIHSYGSMGALYARDLTAETKDRLTASFVTVAPAFTVQGLSNTLHGLSKMGFRMEEWPDALAVKCRVWSPFFERRGHVGSGDEASRPDFIRRHHGAI